METTTTPPAKIKIKSITFGSMEGLTHNCEYYEGRSYSSLADFNLALRSLARDCAPDMLGCNKTDFVITWEDSTTYQGTYELRRESPCFVEWHVRQFLEFAARLKKPFHLTQEQYMRCTQYFSEEDRTGMKNLLSSYELGKD